MKRPPGWRPEGSGPPAETPPELFPLVAAQKAIHRSHAYKEWETEWSNPIPTSGTRAARAQRKIAPTLNKRALHRYKSLDRARSSMLCQASLRLRSRAGNRGTSAAALPPLRRAEGGDVMGRR